MIAKSRAAQAPRIARTGPHAPAPDEPAHGTLPPERMSRVDTAWLRMDTEANLMMIIGVWLVSPRLSLDALNQRVRERLLCYPRFRQKVVEDAMGAHWIDDPDFDLAAHVVPAPLSVTPGQDPQDRLKAFVGELASVPLDRKRPLWQFHLVETLEPGTSALVARVHHCIADGIALISVILSLTDGGSAPPRRRHHQAAHEGHDAAELHGIDWLADHLLRPATDLAVKAIGLTGDGVGKSMHLLADPSAPVAGTMDLARLGAQVVSDAAALALMPDDSPTSLKGKAGRVKRVAWGEPIPLDEVKAVGQAFGASINDILLASVAGAIGRYLRDRGEPVDGREIRAMVPVNLRRQDDAWKLGNHFGLVPLVLPVGIAHPVERLAEVRRRMDELKGGYQPLMAFGLLAVAGMLVKPMQSALLNLFARKATAVMTNVPGPREALQLCGATLRQVMFWVPSSGDIGLGVSILSYAGGVQFGLIADAGLCPDPDEIVQRLRPAFDEYEWLGLMLPWPGDRA